MARSVFQTGTGKNATVAAIAGLIVAIAPNVSGILARKFPEARADIEDATSALVQVLGIISLMSGGAAVANRASAKDRVWSPSWLPGFNKEDCVQPLSMDVPQVNMHQRVEAMAIEQFVKKSVPKKSEKIVVSNPQDAI